MKNHKNTNYFWRLLIHLQSSRHVGEQNGYAMLVTSILAILVFSMLSVYLFSTNLYRSVANNVVDSGTTFYAAEAALNKRANIVRNRFEIYQPPTGTSPAGSTIAEQMANCMSNSTNPLVIGTGDLGCRPLELQNLAATSLRSSDGGIKYKESTIKQNQNGNGLVESQSTNTNINYRTYSFLKDVTNYDGSGLVQASKVEVGEPFAGLNMLDYRYRIYVSAAKEVNNGLVPNDVAAQTMLQMEFSNRLIPLFQFAAFYENDLEITSSSEMLLGGPIHSNSALRLVPGGTLTLLNKATANKGIYKGLLFVATHGSANTTPSPVKTVQLNTTSIDVSGAWTTANQAFTSQQISNANGQLVENSPELKVPDAGDLDRVGVYAQKADLSVDFTPVNTSRPFTVRALGRDLPAAELQSLRQPVLASLNPLNGDNALGERTTLCATTATAPATLANVTQQQNLKKAMQKEMLEWIRLNPTAPTNYSLLASPIGTTVRNSLQTRSGITTLNTTWTWHQLAAMTGDCWLPAPLKVLSNQRDRREMITDAARRMTILQSDIKSLSVWNRDGKVWDGSTLTDVNNPLYVRAAQKPSILANAANGYTMEELGLGANDSTEGGLVWHFSVEKGNPAKVASYPTGQSTYGFAFSGGKYLPGALSLVTDQAAYVQGDYNDARNFSPVTTAIATVPSWTARLQEHKKPAAVMADTITVLSNSCLNSDKNLNCFELVAGNSLPVVQTGQASSINAAFLSRTMQSAASGANSGGLNNYFRMLEDWSNKVFSYSGSMISLGTPREFSAPYRSGGGSTVTDPTNAGYFVYTIPTRNFSYDTSFNSIAGLPPMTPRAVYLKQKVFKRSYNTGDRNVSR
jgi:Tfp pilus assembly protein PilX